MTLKNRILATAGALAMASFATAANAASVLIEGTGLWGKTTQATDYSKKNTSFQFSFTLPSNPIATNPTSLFTDFSYTLNGTKVTDTVNSIEFFDDVAGGMFDLKFGGTTVSIFGFDIGSTKFFTTPESYFFTSGLNGSDGLGRGFLTVTSIGAVPEPATWALMIAGFGVVGMAMRRRRTKVSVSYA